MEFRAGSPADAEAIAGLIASFQSELTDDPSGAGAEQYFASVSVQAEREYLASERYQYLLAYSDSQLTGFIAIRDGSHLFHLFVERSRQRQGIARRLWERALLELCTPGSDGGFLRSTQALLPCGCIKPSALFQQGQYRVCMASRFYPCGVRHCRAEG
jgi:GNAT superfamily N-acetyltransferase